MPAIIIPRRSIVQPQGNSSVNCGNGITSGLLLAHNGADAVLGGSSQFGTLAPSRSAHGVGWLSGSAANYISAPANYVPAADSPWSLFLHYSLITPPTSDADIFNIGDSMLSATGRILFRDNGFSKVVIAKTNGVWSGSPTYGYGAQSAQQSVVVAVTYDGQVARIYYNGLAGSTQTVALSAAATSWYWGGLIVATQLLHAQWARCLSHYEVAELSQNPWQIFRADPVRFYSFPSGPITLNSLTASNITSSGARFTVGLTR